MSASEVELDMYNELTNIGGGNAATALSQMLNQHVDISLPRSMELTLADLDQLVGEDYDEVAVVLITVVGDLAGTLTMIVGSPERMNDLLGVPAEFAESALAEIGNIVASRFLISIGQMIGMEGEVEPPAVGFAPRSAALETVVALAAHEEPFFVLEMDMTINGEDRDPELLYLPAAETIGRLRGLC